MYEYKDALRVINSIKLKEAREIVREYIILHGKNVSPTTLYHKASALKKFFNTVMTTEIDLEAIKKFFKINVKKVTLQQYCMIIKHFLKKYPELVKDEKVLDALKIRVKKKETIRVKSRDQLPTITEINKMIAFANTMYKAAIALLYDTAIRASELCNIRLRHIHFHSQYASIDIVESKTKRRIVYVIESLPYLLSWIQIHPKRDDPDAFLFLTKNMTQLTPHKLNNMLYYISKKVTGKKYSAHLFRHLRYTIWKKELPDTITDRLMGWEKGSKMRERYEHLIDSDVEEIVLEKYGIRERKRKRIKLTSIECPRCGKKNIPGAIYCTNCGFLLNVRNIDDLKEAEELETKILQVILSDRTLLKQIVDRLKKSGDLEKFK